MKRTLKDFWNVDEPTSKKDCNSNEETGDDVDEMSLEQLDEHSEIGSDSISSSTMSTAPTMTGCSSQLSVASTSTSSASRQVIPVDIAANKTENPVQPVIEFPVTMFGKVGCSFQERWYQQYPWLEYSKELDAAFCFSCRFFHPRPLRSEKAFTLMGFKDWKHALGKNGILTVHSTGKAHTEAMMSWKEYQMRAKAGSSIGMQLDQMGTQVISQNRAYVAALMEAVLFSSQQGIAFRGHDENDDSLNPGNFKALMQFLSRHCQAISVRFQEHSKSAVWLSPSFQNEIIHFLSVEVRGMIEQELHEAQYYTLLADESKDMSKREQLSIAFRYIYKFRTVERFVGFTLASELNARALADYIFQKVSDLKLDLGNLVSQCYDGASVMSGCNTGVQTIIKGKCPQAVYIHCSAHRLNLVLVDVSKQVKAASDFFAHLQSIYVFFSSSKCHELFLSIQKAKGGKEIRLKKLSDTRWSCRYDSIVAVMGTYSALLETLGQTADITDRMKAIEATGILAGLKSYDFVVSLTVYKKVLGITSKLSDVLQKESLHYGSAASLIQATIDTFESMRSDGQWDLLWQESVAFANHHGIEMSHPRSRRQRHTPAAMESYVLTTETVGNNTLPELSSENYKVHVYFATIDVIVSEMKERFSNTNISLLKSVGSLNPKSKNFLSPSCLSPILSHYSDILPQGNLENEVSTLKNYLVRNPTTEDDESLHHLLQLIDPVKEAFPVLRECLLIAMTLGTSTATVERSFSSLRRLKTYLRSTMSQQRLDDLAIPYIERDLSSRLWQSINDLVLKFAQTHKNAKITLL